jgi:hypothetical protein
MIPGTPLPRPSYDPSTRRNRNASVAITPGMSASRAVQSSAVELTKRPLNSPEMSLANHTTFYRTFTQLLPNF